MAIRHRTPTIFSIYMVDVLCCALGCVILLWQLYHTESEEQTLAARSALDKLAQSEIDLSNITGERDEARSERDSLKSELDAEKKLKIQVTLELDAKTKLADQKARLVIVREAELKALRETYAIASAAAETLIDKLKLEKAELLKAKMLTSADLMGKLKALADAESRLAALEDELKLKALAAKVATDKADRSTVDLKTLQKLYDELRATYKGDLAKLNVSEEDRKRLEKALLASGKDIALLKERVERRFEGISLEGKKICFLIDISGSMVMRDSKATDATKWPKVVATIERVAASLVDVESYQVVLFSNEVSYLFKEGRRDWIPFDKATSPKKIGDALRSLRPDGGTNLYVGLEEAFEMRKKGMETLYVFSDGLPTEGPGLTEADTKLSDALQSEKLGRHIRNRLQTLWNQPILGRRVAVNAIGFYFESPDVGAFLWSLARENEGSFVGMSRP